MACDQQMMDKEDMLHIYNGILLSHKNNKIIPFEAIWMDLDIIILNKVRHRKMNIISYNLHVESKKMIQMY